MMIDKNRFEKCGGVEADPIRVEFDFQSLEKDNVVSMFVDLRIVLYGMDSKN